MGVGAWRNVRNMRIGFQSIRACIRAAATTAAGIALTLSAATAASPAQAAEPALAAPGAPMRIVPEQVPPTFPMPTGRELKVPPEFFSAVCSQGPIGTVRTPDGTQRVMLTASHCVNTLPGRLPVKNEISTPVGQQYIRLGERVASNHVAPRAMDLSDPMESIRTADWGVVRLDDAVVDTSLAQSRDWEGGNQSEPVRLTTIKDYRTLAPGEVSVDNFGQPICKDGSTSGRTCAQQIGRTRNGVYSWNLGYAQGDSGGVNFDPRDGAIIGVSSMTLGPLGKTQPADRIIEDAYGVADGHVNEVFTVSESTAPHANFDIPAEEEKRVEAEIARLNPGVTPPVPREELRKAIGEAQSEAQQIADRAIRGDFDVREVQQRAEHHAERISFWGTFTAVEEVVERLP